MLCFTGHKSLMGPMGIGGMYVREDVEIRQTRAGGTGVRSAQRHHLEEYPYRMEYGTPNLPGIAGLNAGVKWVLERGLEDIRAHEMRLWAALRDGLRGIEGVTSTARTRRRTASPSCSSTSTALRPPIPAPCSTWTTTSPAAPACTARR